MLELKRSKICDSTCCSNSFRSSSSPVIGAMTPLDSVISRMIAFPQSTIRRHRAKLGVFCRNKYKVLLVLAILLIATVFQIIASIYPKRNVSFVEEIKEKMMFGNKVSNNQEINNNLDAGGSQSRKDLEKSEIEAIKAKIEMEKAIGKRIKPSKGVALVLLPAEFTDKYDAYCIDGSPPGFYIRTGKDWLNWILYLPEGPICVSVEECIELTNTKFGSSTQWRNEETFEGILSNDKRINPYFHDWSAVYFMSCDGGLFLGHGYETIKYKGISLRLRGAFVFKAIIEYLKEHHHLAMAHNVMLAGSSSGGIGVLGHVDHLKTMLTGVNNIKAVVDGSIIVDDGEGKISAMLNEAFHLHTMRYSFQVRTCTKKTHSDTKWLCISPSKMLDSIKSPVYIISSLHDTEYFAKLLHMSCKLPDCSRQTLHTIKKRGEILLKDIRSILKPWTRNALITTCSMHTCLNNNSLFTSNLAVGVSPQSAVGQWFLRWSFDKYDTYIETASPFMHSLKYCG